jgi:hypothetical protein
MSSNGNYPPPPYCKTPENYANPKPINYGKQVRQDSYTPSVNYDKHRSSSSIREPENYEDYDMLDSLYNSRKEISNQHSKKNNGGKNTININFTQPPPQQVYYVPKQRKQVRYHGPVVNTPTPYSIQKKYPNLSIQENYSEERRLLEQKHTQELLELEARRVYPSLYKR